MRVVVLRSLAVACGLAVFAPAGAQQAGRIAAVVNDDIVTGYDVAARMAMVFANSNLADTPENRQRYRPSVLRALIDERLQNQEARRLGIEVSDGEMAVEIAAIERRNEQPPGGLARYFRQNGLDIAAFREQLRAAMGWRQVIRRRVVPRIEVGADEVDARLAELRGLAGSSEWVVSEIFLPVGGGVREDEARAAAEGIIDQLRRGASFAALARQFSQSSSAAVGGDLGRVRPGQLDERLEAALAAMQPNRVSAPIRLENGYHLLFLREIGAVEATPPESVELALKRLYLPAAEGASDSELAALGERATAIGESVAGCADMERAAGEAGAEEPVDIGRLKLADLPDALRELVAELPVERASRTIRWLDGVLLLMICERIEPPADLEERREIERELRLARINRRAARYLGDLRRAASISRRL